MTEPPQTTPEPAPEPPSEPPAEVTVPAGLEPMPDFGPHALAARFTEKANTGFWVKGSLWLLASIVILVSGWAVLLADVSGLAIVGLPALVCAGLGVKNLILARFGSQPALVIDDQQLHSLAPFVRLSVRLEGISWINAIGHDLLIAARGAISKRGRLSNARWATITNAHALGVTRAELADYIAARADVLKAPKAGSGG